MVIHVIYISYFCSAVFLERRHLAAFPLRTCGSVRAQASNPLLPVVTAVAVPTSLIPSAADEQQTSGEHLSLQLSVSDPELPHSMHLNIHVY